MTRIKNLRKFAIALLGLIPMYAAIPAHAQYSVLSELAAQSTGPLQLSGQAVQGSDGGLYGTSLSIGGGINGNNGTVFKISLSGQLRVLYAFCAKAKCADGALPHSGLTLRPDGHFLGTTYFGGNGTGCPDGCGTIFDVSQTGSLTTVHSFAGGTDGSKPMSPPVLGPDEEFYGLTYSGGNSSNCGTIYRITRTGITTLYDFGPSNCNPMSLVLGADGNFYGTTSFAGTPDPGAFFRAQLHAGSIEVTFLHTFAAPTESTCCYFVLGGDGNFYGTAFDAEVGPTSEFGTVLKITPAGIVSVLHDLNGTTDGSQPVALSEATDGNFYGVAQNEGACATSGLPGCGTLFRITPEGSYSVVHSFEYATGIVPNSLLQHTNGTLYGYTAGGGSDQCGLNNGCGVFFSWGAGLKPFVSTVQLMAPVGNKVEILGQGFTSATTVSFNGVAASATVQSGTSLWAVVPAGATTGPVTVTTSTGTLTSNRPFVVRP